MNSIRVLIGFLVVTIASLQGCAVTIEKDDVFTLRDKHLAVSEVQLEPDLDRARLSEIRLEVDGGIFMGYRYAAPKSERAVLFFPGNGYGAPAAVSRVARLFGDGQTDLYLLSYGQPNEAVPSVGQVYSMGSALADFAAETSRIGTARVTAVGHSLGGWVALHLAGTSRVGCTVVAGTGTTAVETVVHLVPKSIGWLASFRPSPDVALLNNVELAKKSQTPVLVVGSTADTIMPVDRSRNIFSQLPVQTGSELFVSTVATHGSYFRDPEVIEKIRSFIRKKCDA